MSESKPHSELVERVREASAGDIPPAPWTWDAEWDSLKGADGRYVLCTRLDFHGRDEEGDNFTSHLDLLKGEDLIALAPEMAAALISLEEQLEASRRQRDKAAAWTVDQEVRIESLQKLANDMGELLRRDVAAGAPERRRRAMGAKTHSRTELLQRLATFTSNPASEPLACACVGGDPCPCRQAAWDKGEPWERDREAFDRGDPSPAKESA